MKKGSFNLEGFAVDCSGLPAMGDAGKVIFRALKVACNSSSNDLPYPLLNNDSFICVWIGKLLISNKHRLSRSGLSIIHPSDVLGQAAIDAAMDGATLVFEGDSLPDANKVVYYGNRHISRAFFSGGTATSNIIAYKLLDEKPRHRVPSIQSRVLSEKMGFKELCPVCSPKEWSEREAETYDELRDAHLSVVMANEAKDKEIELLKQRIKDMHRAINDAKVVLDV